MVNEQLLRIIKDHLIRLTSLRIDNNRANLRSANETLFRGCTDVIGH
jgi:hypothetical protein